MSDLPLPSFPADAANRSFYLGHIWKRVEKTEVWRLLAPKSIDLWSINLYWDTRLPRKGHHRGYCLVEFQTRELAILAWARLDGLVRWNRKLVVGPVNIPGALQPSQEELNAAKESQSSEYADSGRDDMPDAWLNHDVEEFFPMGISLLKAQGIKLNTRDPPAPKKPTNEIELDPDLIETIYENAGKVMLGWGGYAPFQANPFRRAIDPSKVLALNWHDPGPMRFVSDRGEVMLELPPCPPEWEEGEKRTESLWFLLAQASGEWTDEELREMEETLPLPADVGL